MKLKTVALIPILLVFTLGAGRCGGFNLDLRGIFAASPAFIDSLDLGGDRAAIAADFIALAGGAVTLNDDLKACSDNPCKVRAVDRFSSTFASVTQDEAWSAKAKLRRIKQVATGLLLAARVYFGAPGPESAMSEKDAEADMRAKIAELKSLVK